jgi:two-component system response regulator AlgR
MALRVLIVDDEPLARARLRALLGDCHAPAALVCGEADNATEAMALLQREVFDLALLDIHMPGSDGLVLANNMRSLPHPPSVVFVTAYSQYAVQAFEVEATDYLTKPVRLQRLQHALHKVERMRKLAGMPAPAEADDAILIQDRGRTERVPLSQVLYLKAELKYVTVRTLARSYILDGALNELEARHGTHFVRIHRNALVARRVLRALEKHHDPEDGDGWAVRLHGLDEPLAVSRRQLSAVRDVLAG